jgi:hypothetical protein
MGDKHIKNDTIEMQPVAKPRSKTTDNIEPTKRHTAKIRDPNAPQQAPHALPRHQGPQQGPPHQDPHQAPHQDHQGPQQVPPHQGPQDHQDPQQDDADIDPDALPDDNHLEVSQESDSSSDHDDHPFEVPKVPIGVKNSPRKVGNQQPHNGGPEEPHNGDQPHLLPRIDRSYRRPVEDMLAVNFHNDVLDAATNQTKMDILIESFLALLNTRKELRRFEIIQKKHDEIKLMKEHAKRIEKINAEYEEFVGRYEHAVEALIKNTDDQEKN